MPTDKPDQRPEAKGGERIAKLLARAGIASRREVERMIQEGRIARDGVPLDTPATVLTSLRGITVDGEPVAAPEPARLFLFHKPTGTLTAERDFSGRPTIYDKLPKDLPRLVPVGRLDLNTEGLLLMTTDGGLKRQLELPATGVERAYRARAYGQVTQTQLEDLMEGVEIEGVRYGSIDANLERRTGANVWIEMVLTEGKNREVRNVLEYLGLRVSRLIRTRYGPFVLGDLPPGAIGEVAQNDLIAFRQTLGVKRGIDPMMPISVSGTGARAAPRPRAAPTGDRAPYDPAARKDARPARPQRPAGPGPDRAARPVGEGGRSARQPVRTSRAEKEAVRVPRPPRAPAARDAAPEPDVTLAPRPAKIERKAGWAKPKPKGRDKGKRK
ncbi:rRNA pseudouridine synthase [Sphingomonas sp. SUN019]|uniref:pseudouridine synthase n=1 Tax=Sphingomonas sp. SUN019 TaxID=2937788 RepID=UPI002164D0B2|nr:pseudouridine synthase [Sphingomonas sp. SUN019]UVO49309.1 rRNA pseudouridine synthase [Sphingomonas sp. SUN019]